MSRSAGRHFGWLPSERAASLSYPVPVLDLMVNHMGRNVEPSRYLVDVAAVVEHVENLLHRRQEFGGECTARRLTFGIVEIVHHGTSCLRIAHCVADCPGECEVLHPCRNLPSTAFAQVNPDVAIVAKYDGLNTGQILYGRKFSTTERSCDGLRRFESGVARYAHRTAKCPCSPVAGRPGTLARVAHRNVADLLGRVMELGKTGSVARPAFQLIQAVQGRRSRRMTRGGVRRGRVVRLSDTGQKFNQRFAEEQVACRVDKRGVRVGD